MNIEKAINIYCDRIVEDFEYEIRYFDGEYEIAVWNVEGVKQPKIQDLLDTYEANKETIIEEQEVKELKAKHLQDAIDDMLSKYKPYIDEKKAIKNAKESK